MDLHNNTLPQIFDQIGRLAKILENIHRWTIKDTGMTPAQFHVLFHLNGTTGLKMTDLAKMSFCTPPTMTAIVDILEMEKKLVQRVTHKSDRRQTIVQLTTEGKALISKVPPIDNLFESCCNGLTAPEQQLLVSLLDKLETSLMCEQP